MQKLDCTRSHVASREPARDPYRRILPKSRRKRTAAAARTVVEPRPVEKTISLPPRARRPVLAGIDERSATVGVDIRPTTTTLALATSGLRIQLQRSIPTGNNPSQFITRLILQIRELMQAHPQLVYRGIGIALPGRMDLSSQRIVSAPHLGWRDLDLKQPLERTTGIPVELENDGNACALGELWSGLHTVDLQNLLAVSITEGISVGMILNRQLARGQTGAAGEFAHVTLDAEGPVCKCGNRGCWELYASSTAALRYYAEALARARPPRPAPRKTTFSDLLGLAEQGDPKALKALDQMAHYLGEGLAMLVTGMAPEVIVLSGEVTVAWKRIGGVISKVLQSRQATRTMTRILPANPSTQPRLRGAIALVLQKHLGALAALRSPENTRPALPKVLQ